VCVDCSAPPWQHLCDGHRSALASSGREDTRTDRNISPSPLISTSAGAPGAAFTATFSRVALPERAQPRGDGKCSCVPRAAAGSVGAMVTWCGPGGWHCLLWGCRDGLGSLGSAPAPGSCRHLQGFRAMVGRVTATGTAARAREGALAASLGARAELRDSPPPPLLHLAPSSPGAGAALARQHHQDG